MNSNSKFTGSAFANIGIGLLTGFVSVITLGFAFPWMVCMRQRWIARNTIIDGKRLRFVGKGGWLFGNYIKWAILTAITFCIYGIWVSVKYQNWITTHTHIVEEAE